MSQNKNALVRYKVLDKCFRNPGKRYFIEDLISECESALLEMDPDSNGISRRQIFEDISFMESKEGWEIELVKNRVGRKVYYRYNNLSFSINNMPLNEVEVNNLKEAFSILSHFKGMPQFEWINETLPKLHQGTSSDSKSCTIMEFDSNRYLKGVELVGSLYNAIFYKRVLQISYHPFEMDSPLLVTIHPYYLKQYNNRWFLFGYNQENQRSDWNLALDRIVSIEETDNKYKINNSIDWHEYFEDIIGVTKPAKAKPERIVLLFFGKTGKYIETKPLHGSQKSKWIDGETLEVSINVIVNYELERLILSYADTAKVLRPENLAGSIKIRLQKALKEY